MNYSLAYSLTRSLAKKALRFLMPWTCVGCRTALGSLEDTGFCGRCWLSIPRIQGLVCQACGIPLQRGGALCYPCRRQPPPLLVRAAVEYHGVIPPAVHRFKYSGRKSLATALGTLLQYGWTQYSELHDVQGLVPVPLFGRHERIRGFNQAELLCDQLAVKIGLPVLPLLIRKRNTRSQYTLSKPDRRLNVMSAFEIYPLGSPKARLMNVRCLLLIDDVGTTLSTLAECGRILCTAGVRTVKALVLARDL
jgi:competence protein ComFC